MDLCFQHLSRGHMHVPVWYAKRETFAKKNRSSNLEAARPRKITQMTDDIYHVSVFDI